MPGSLCTDGNKGQFMELFKVVVVFVKKHLSLDNPHLCLLPCVVCEYSQYKGEAL